VKQVSHHYGKVKALDSIDLDIPPGIMVGIVGPDGVGKSTLLALLAGSKKLQEGSLTVLGGDIADVRHRRTVCPQIAYMPQGLGKNLYLELSVYDNVDFMAQLFGLSPGERKAKVTQLLEATGLAPFPDRPAGKLSGGMKQKLGLSCALIHQPEVLLLDEPTFGVDPVSRRDLWLIVHEMVAEGVTAVVSTAYLDEAERFDRIALLDHGRLIALATPHDLQRSLHGELLRVRVERVRDARRTLEGNPLVLRSAVFGDRMHVQVRDAARDASEVAAALARAGFPPSEVERIEPSLEDVFLDQVGRAREEEPA
jgi:ribosome-dependent ATPase